MQIKAGVELRGMQPQIVLAMVIADQILTADYRPATITSVTDGEHMPRSLHYKGQAFDLRTSAIGITQPKAELLAKKLRTALGEQFDVVVEKDHIHVEFDPVPFVPEVTA